VGLVKSRRVTLSHFSKFPHKQKTLYLKVSSNGKVVDLD
jgi:hypothetical protein